MTALRRSLCEDRSAKFKTSQHPDFNRGGSRSPDRRIRYTRPLRHFGVQETACPGGKPPCCAKLETSHSLLHSNCTAHCAAEQRNCAKGKIPTGELIRIKPQPFLRFPGICQRTGGNFYFPEDPIARNVVARAGIEIVRGLFHNSRSYGI